MSRDHNSSSGYLLRVLLALLCVLGFARTGETQRDICGCAGSPRSLGAFDSGDPATYPPGTTSAFRSLTIPLSEDGVLVFSSFTVRPRPSDIGFITVRFQPNAANTPVTLLVSGNITITDNATLEVNGVAGETGTFQTNGEGGAGGPGGFPGGDGAYQVVNFARDGGTGVGPGGGAGGTATPFVGGGNGTFVGAAELLPLVGGSGGGGGPSTQASVGCSAGGGGGGGGAILLASNGTVTLDGTVTADGGFGGSTVNGNCAWLGGRGSGGAIRIIANSITGIGRLLARPGGRIRAEAFSIAFSATSSDPVVSRAPAPGPVVSPLTPTVRVTDVGGQAVPPQPTGAGRGIDVILPAPGAFDIGVATSGVPTGTIVEVTVKPRVGAAPFVSNVTLTNCDPSGDCIASTTMNLPGGAHVVEARATFRTP
jgi:hypothetical protein